MSLWKFLVGMVLYLVVLMLLGWAVPQSGYHDGMPILRSGVEHAP